MHGQVGKQSLGHNPCIAFRQQASQRYHQWGQDTHPWSCLAMHTVSLSSLSQSMFSAPALNTSARVDRLNITEDAHGSLRVRKAHRRPKRYSNGRTRASKKRNRARARYGRVQTRRSRPASLSSTSSRRSARAASIQRSPPTCTRTAIMKIDDRGVFHFAFSPGFGCDGQLTRETSRLNWRFRSRE